MLVPPVLAKSAADCRGPLRIGDGRLTVVRECDVGLETHECGRPQGHAHLHGQMPVDLVPLAAADDVLVCPAPRRGCVRNLVVGDQAVRKVVGATRTLRQPFQTACEEVAFDVLAQQRGGYVVGVTAARRGDFGNISVEEIHKGRRRPRLGHHGRRQGGVDRVDIRERDEQLIKRTERGLRSTARLPRSRWSQRCA